MRLGGLTGSICTFQARIQALHSSTEPEHFCVLGLLPTVDTKKQTDRSAGRRHWLHDFVVTCCLAVPAVQRLEKPSKVGEGLLV